MISPFKYIKNLGFPSRIKGLIASIVCFLLVLSGSFGQKNSLSHRSLSKSDVKYLRGLALLRVYKDPDSFLACFFV